MHKYVVITDSHSAPGFMLAGVEVVVVERAGEADAQVRRCLDDPEVGLVALNDSYLKGLSPPVRRRVERSAMPVVVPFPNLSSISAADVESYLTSVISAAIGYRIRLRA